MRWLALLLLSVATNAAAAPLVIERAIVENQPVRTKYMSGVFCWSYRLDIKTDKGERFPVYVVYLSPDQPIPKRGATCRIEYEMGKAGSCSVVSTDPPRSVKKAQDPNKIVPYVDRLTCSAYLE